MLSPPETVFIFVAFVVVANLVSKHLAMKHERALKFGEAHKGSWPNGSVAIFLVAAVAPALLFFWGSGGMPRLSTHETVFAFVAFVVAANLISKHFTMKHELALKHEKVQESPVPQKHKQENAPMFYGVKVGILFALSALIPLTAILLWFIDSPPAQVAVDGIPNAPNVMTPVPVSPNPFAAPQDGMAEAAHGFVPDSISTWTDDLPFDADQYPSIEACAVPLARKIAKEIIADQYGEVEAEASDSEKEKQPEVVASVTIVNERSFTEFVEFKDALQKALKSELPAISFQSRTDGKNYVLVFGFDELQKFPGAFPDKIIALRSGKVVCRWYRAIENGKPVESLGKEHAVAFTEKPWLTDFHNFTSIYPDSRFHLGVSSKVEPLKSKAHERAVQDVANRLNLRAEQIEPRIAGTFTQTIERPYGKVYREAILVQDPPQSSMQHLAGNLPGTRVQGYQTPLPRLSFEFSLAMIVCLTVVAGFISNIATQGYYRTRISRTLMVVTSLAIIVILLIVVSSLA